MKIGWYHTNHYKCKLKGKEIAAIYMGNYGFEPNLLKITVLADKDVENYVNVLSEQTFEIFLNKIKRCDLCSHIKTKSNPRTHHCRPENNFTLHGKEYKNICSINPVFRFHPKENSISIEDFAIIKEFINAKLTMEKQNLQNATKTI